MLFCPQFPYFFRFQNKIGTADEQNNVSNKCEFCKTLHSESHTLSKGVNGFIPVLPTFKKKTDLNKIRNNSSSHSTAVTVVMKRA